VNKLKKVDNYSWLGFGSVMKHRILVAIFLFVIAFAVYIPSLKGGFVWDDFLHLRDVHHNLKLSDIGIDVLTNVAGGKHYRPILFASLAVDSEIWELSPFGFHLTNVILHSICTVLVFYLIIMVLGELSVNRKNEIAFLSSFLFAVFPAHVESVAFISARADIICCIFFSLAFIFHLLSFRNLLYFCLAAVFFALSLMSKEVAIAFPIVAIGLDLATRRIKNRRSVLRYSIYLALLILYVYIRGLSSELIPNFSTESRAAVGQEAGELIGNDDVNGLEEGVIKAEDLSTVFLSSYLFYVKKLIFPYHITPFIVAVPGGYRNAIASISTLLILFVAGYLSLWKREFVGFFCIVWILATLLPSALVSIVSISPNPLAERFLYIPSVGFCIIAAYVIIEIGRKANAEGGAWVFAFLLVLSYIFPTFAGQRIWKDDMTLWKIITDRNPSSFIPHLNYGIALRRAGENDDAIRQYLTALDPRIRSSPRARGRAAIDLGVAYLNKGDFVNSELWFQRSVDFYPKYQDKFYYNMGLLHYVRAEYIFKQRGYADQDYETSINFLNQFLANKPTDAKCHLLLAKVYLRLGMGKEAREHAKEALRLGLANPLAIQARRILDQHN
jgi:tetratricopeptide (TPR) repeat protein